MPTAAELCGGAWDGGPPPVDDYARAAALVAAGTVRGWALRADTRTDAAADNGRPVVAHPAPVSDPVWVDVDPATGVVLGRGVDFDAADGAATVEFDTDPLAAAAAGYLVWPGGVATPAADVWYGPAPPAAVIPGYQAGTYAALAAAYAGACDSPATAATAETVEAVWRGPDGVWRVVTDVAAYRLPAYDAPNAMVVAGLTLPAGTPLGTAWTLTRLGPDLPDVDYLTVPAWYTQGVTTGNVTFYPGPTPLVISSAGGHTVVKFALGASAPDLAAYWAASDARGQESGARSLAHALDTRANPVGEPGPESLPVVIRPLEFVCREVFAGTAFQVVLEPSRFGPAAAADVDRRKAVTAAAGTSTCVFEWDGPSPSVPELSP
jgi:hypothetical protein